MERQFAFCRKQRLGGKDIAVILASGRRYRAGSLVVQLRRNQLDLARLGLIVPKRYHALSVDRNALKRQIREWFRLRQDKLKGYDVLVRVTGPSSSFSGLSVKLDQLGLPN